MKRYPWSPADAPEQPLLRLQHVIPEASQRRFGQSARFPATDDRLFALRGALLDQFSDTPAPQSDVTRH
jgi:hypothetical protein